MLMPCVESGDMMKNTKKHSIQSMHQCLFMSEDAGKCSMVSMLNGSHTRSSRGYGIRRLLGIVIGR